MPLALTWGTAPLLEEIKDTGLGVFVRSLVGMNYEAAKHAFSALVSGSILNADQIEFIELVIEELMQNGIAAPERLFEPPFTDINAQGPAAMFSSAQVTQIVAVLNEAKARAVA